MTLKEVFELLAANPIYVLFYFCIIPVAAYLAGILGKGEGHLTPWKILYSTLIYFVCVPGIFAISLNVYLFLFERQSIFDMDLYTQVLPVVSMVATLLIIRQNVSLDRIPGFDKLSGLIMIISSTLAIMWFIDRTHIVVFSYLRFEMVLLIFVLLLIAIRYGWSRLFSAPNRA